MRSSIFTEGAPPGDTAIEANLRPASDGYFDTMHIPLLAGRDIATHRRCRRDAGGRDERSVGPALWPTHVPRDAIGKRINVSARARQD